MAEIFVYFFACKSFAFMAFVYTVLTPRVEGGVGETLLVGEIGREKKFPQARFLWD